MLKNMISIVSYSQQRYYEGNNDHSMYLINESTYSVVPIMIPKRIRSRI